jgi:hypothetical protein
MKFDWDIKKENENQRKHKIPFLDACLIFADKYSLTLLDSKHSTTEERWITFGQTPKGKLLVVVHTYRNIKGKEVVRIISARKATKKEEIQYFNRRK